MSLSDALLLVAIGALGALAFRRVVLDAISAVGNAWRVRRERKRDREHEAKIFRISQHPLYRHHPESSRPPPAA